MAAVVAITAAIAACPGGSGKKSAVPTEVEIEWPDAGVSQPPVPADPADPAE